MFDKSIALANAQEQVEAIKARLINAHHTGDFRAIERGKKELAAANATLRSIQSL